MRHRMEGIIAACGFASGHRVVVGHWARSPVGPMSDVMWADPDGARTLFAPTHAVAAFVTAVYDFDRVEVGALDVSGDERGVEVSIRDGARTVHMGAGPGWHIPPSRRPAALTRWVEAPIARALMGVHTYGVTPRGVREWYQATTWRPVTSARATLAGRDLGVRAAVDPPCRFGFSEPPPRPSITAVRPLLEDPSGRLDRILAERRD
ncbi:hypothetical protein [Iamia sp.]|uniref:hypothetical protein n=1 Tax=Iamia sp. TaxID=2722710 RepID=UPI002BCC5923|nr:hypothetical protein [Iamia sp.]HXH57047.1 hypothetical protein [Iamia sp.]